SPGARLPDQGGGHRGRRGHVHGRVPGRLGEPPTEHPRLVAPWRRGSIDRLLTTRREPADRGGGRRPARQRGLSTRDPGRARGHELGTSQIVADATSEVSAATAVKT